MIITTTCTLHKIELHIYRENGGPLPASPVGLLDAELRVSVAVREEKGFLTVTERRPIWAGPVFLMRARTHRQTLVFKAEVDHALFPGAEVDVRLDWPNRPSDIMVESQLTLRTRLT